MNIKNKVSTAIFLLLLGFCMGARSSTLSQRHESSSIYYAEQMGEFYNLEDGQRQEIFHIHAQKLIDWAKINPVKDSVERQQRIKEWSTTFRVDVMKVIGTTDQEVWKQYNEEIQKGTPSPVSKALIARYTKPVSQKKITPAPPEKNPTPEAAVMIRFEKGDGINESMHRRARYFAIEAGKEFGLTPGELQVAYDLQTLNIKCWNEISTLQKAGKSEEYEAYKDQINEAFLERMHELLDPDNPDRVNAFKKRMFTELKTVR